MRRIGILENDFVTLRGFHLTISEIMHPTEHYTSFTEIPTVLKNETRISALREIYSISLIGRHVTTKKPFSKGNYEKENLRKR